MGCTDSREETKKLDKEDTEKVTRNAKSVLAYAFGRARAEIVDSRPYMLSENPDQDLLQTLAETWGKLHERVDERALPIVEDDEEEFQDTSRNKAEMTFGDGPDIDEDEEVEFEQEAVESQEEDAPEEDESEEELEEARPGLATVLGRRR